MNFRDYIKDKAFYLAVSAAAWLLIFWLFLAFQVNGALAVIVLTLFVLWIVLFLGYDYQRKKRFYHNLLENTRRLDQAYLVLETLQKPVFYEGRLLFEALYEIDKSMAERVRDLENRNEAFKEYIEMWIHEVKIPLAALSLHMHNHPNQTDKVTTEQLKRLNDYVEQVLFYARSEEAEKDYCIARTSLAKVVGAVAMKNKDDLLENHVEFIVRDMDRFVLTDAKWLEFILNQIVNNSIKYRKDEGSSYIQLYVEETTATVSLAIRDNGIGIPEEDLRRVFDKSFTGYNGRIKSKSTGMGLYIAKKLCEKLGHELAISSVWGEYTEVRITFHKDTFHDVLN